MLDLNSFYNRTVLVVKNLKRFSHFAFISSDHFCLETGIKNDCEAKFKWVSNLILLSIKKHTQEGIFSRCPCGLTPMVVLKDAHSLFLSFLKLFFYKSESVFPFQFDLSFILLKLRRHKFSSWNFVSLCACKVWSSVKRWSIVYKSVIGLKMWYIF